MSNRPEIPAAVKRVVLFESGHCCAVCGAGCPLEQAHIVPWCKSKEHKVENLICLCANCHGRADRERWSQKTLRQYKRRPWILRHLDSPIANKNTTEIEIRIKISGPGGNDTDLENLLKAIAKIGGNKRDTRP